MLHTLQHSPYHIDFQLMTEYIQSDDILLLMYDGVLAALKQTEYNQLLISLNIPIYALESDIEARGLKKYIEKSIKMVSYTGFVELSEEHQQQIVW